MFKHLVSYLVFLFLSSSMALDMSPSGVYLATKDACAALPEKVLFSGAVYDEVYAGHFSTREYFEIDKNIRTQSMKNFLAEFNFQKKSDFANYLLKSDDFKRALLECYPENSRAYRFFYESVSRADRAGKTVGLVATLLIFKGTGAIYSGAAGALSRLAQMSFQVANRWVDIAMLSTMLTSSSEIKHLVGSESRDIKPTIDLNQAAGLLLKDNQNNLEKLRTQIEIEKNPIRVKEMQRKIEQNQKLIESLNLIKGVER